jgi:hypothetical protein
VSMTAESVRRCVSLKRFGAVVIVSKMVVGVGGAQVFKKFKVPSYILFF